MWIRRADQRRQSKQVGRSPTWCDRPRLSQATSERGHECNHLRPPCISLRLSAATEDPDVASLLMKMICG
jgi:hypothetical protein